MEFMRISWSSSSVVSLVVCLFDSVAIWLSLPLSVSYSALSTILLTFAAARLTPQPDLSDRKLRFECGSELSRLQNSVETHGSRTDAFKASKSHNAQRTTIRQRTDGSLLRSASFEGYANPGHHKRTTTAFHNPDGTERLFVIQSKGLRTIRNLAAPCPNARTQRCNNGRR